MGKTLRKYLLEYLVNRRPLNAFKQSAKLLGIKGIVVNLPQNSPLFREEVATSVELPLDEMMTPFVLANGHWQLEELTFFKNNLPPGPSLFVDVGANVGLITRQIIHEIPSIMEAVCFEPNPENHRLLCRNISHLPQVKIVHAALGKENGILDFYEDATNHGNYSILHQAMNNKPYNVSKVECIIANLENVLGNFSVHTLTYPILWKSDTQGFDELIVTTLPDLFWSRVHAGVMELWRIKKPEIDYSRLHLIMSQFGQRYFLDRPDQLLSPDEIVDYCQGNDHFHKDLCFVR